VIIVNPASPGTNNLNGMDVMLVLGDFISHLFMVGDIW